MIKQKGKEKARNSEDRAFSNLNLCRDTAQSAPRRKATLVVVHGNIVST